MCIQSVGLIARSLEKSGIPATLTSWSGALGRLTNPPRLTVTKLNRGSTMGNVGDAVQQRRVLEATLALLEQEAPLKLVRLKEVGN